MQVSSVYRVISHIMMKVLKPIVCTYDCTYVHILCIINGILDYTVQYMIVNTNHRELKLNALSLVTARGREKNLMH